MRNLKKILALVLALMMVLSVMVTASASFEDAASITYTEAVDVMAAAGILNGYEAEDGTTTFNPTGTLTRAEAAKLIAYLATGGKIEAIVQCETVFEDVPAGHWASGLINYCFDEGYVNGKSETTYVPSGKITVQEYAKLLLGVMGIKGTYTGATWTKDVRNNAIANKLMEGMTYTWTADVTREQAAQMTFNAMKTGSTYTEDSGYWYVERSGKEVKVSEDDLALYIALGVDVKWMDVPGGSTGFFKAFGITVRTAANGGKDAEGRPALVYTVDNGKDAEGNEIPDTVLAYTEAPVAIFTSDMDAVAAAAAVKSLKTAKYTVDSTVYFTEDGVTSDEPAHRYSAGVAALLEGETGNNVVVELYAGSDKVIDTAVITNTYISLTGKITEADEEEETPETIEIAGEDIVNTTLALEEGVYVTYNKLAGKINVETLAVAEYVVGTLTGYNSKGEYTIDGTVYTLDMGVDAATVQGQFGKSFVYYLGANNTIILTTAVPGEETPEFVMPTDYAVVKASEVYYIVSTNAADSFAGETATKSITFSARVKVLHEDGTYAIYNLPVEKATAAVAGTSVAKGDYFTVINGAPVVLLTAAQAKAAVASQTPYVVDIAAELAAPLYAYTVKDGVIDLYAMTDISTEIKKDTVVIGCTNGAAVANNAIVVTDYYGNNILVNANTKVVYEYYDAEEEAVVTLIGTLGTSNGLPAGYHGMIVAADYNKDDKGVETVVYSAELIYVQDAPVAGTPAPSTNFAYVTGEYTFAGEVVKVAGVEYKIYNYTAYAIDGSVITLKSANAGETAGLYYYDANSYLDGDASGLVSFSGKYNVVAGSTVTVGAQYLNVTANTVVIEIGSATLEAGASVLVFVETGVGANANNIALIFVIG